MPADIVRDFMRELQALDPKRPLAELHRFERQLRDQFGGQRVYVKKSAAAARAPKR